MALYPPFYLKISFFIFFLSSHISRDVHKTEQKEKQLLRLWPAYLSLHVREKDSSIYSLFVVVVYSLSLSLSRSLFMILDGDIHSRWDFQHLKKEGEGTDDMAATLSYTATTERERDTDAASKSPSPKIISTFFFRYRPSGLIDFYFIKKKKRCSWNCCL
jgi:hypothetical protein